ncbi:MAG: hypothetical protein ACLPHP_12320 [Candidatus Sulfotelmatobacter sp.]
MLRDRDDDEVERYLGEFRPRSVRPLELPRPAAKAWMRRLAFAAAVLLCVGGGLWYGRHNVAAPTPSENPPTAQVENPAGTARPNPFALTKLALEDDRQFEAQLDADSRLVLPSFQGEQSSLRVFAKE